MSDRDTSSLRAHPELASLVVLTTQLRLMPTVLAAVHDRVRRDALSDQARAMSRVSRILERQIEAYMDLVEVEQGVRTKRRVG